jgi:hypothetical protein
MSQRVKHWFVWLRRLRHSRGFGIQSPTDYAFVRYVVCEHWPYYAYDTVGQGDDWLTRRLGRLYFRLANWRQPRTVVTDGYEDYFAAGCRRAAVTRRLEGVAELVRVSVEDAVEQVLGHTDERSLLVVEGIWRDKQRWQRLVADERTVITFDLYYCGILMFDRKRTKQHYIINF